MSETQVFFLLGFIRASWQIIERKLSKLDKHAKTATFLNYIVTWIIVVGFVTAYAKAPLNGYLAVIASFLIFSLMFWAYLGEKISKVRFLKVSQFLAGRTLALALSCLVLVTSAFGLFLAGQGLGLYQDYAITAHILGVTISPSPSVAIQSILLNVVVNTIGLSAGVLLIAIASYIEGLKRSSKIVKRLMSDVIT